MPNPLEKVSAEGAGVAKAATARIKGLYGVFNTLAQEHAEASVLLKRTKSANDPDKQRDLWRKLRAELLSHEHGELKEVYPALAEHQLMREVVARHDSEARHLEAAIASVDSADFGTDSWKSALAELQRLVEQHAQTEEKEFFPLATDVIEKDRAQDLDERFKEAKRTVMDKLGVS